MEPTQLFKLLSDETRLRSLLMIQKEKELCVCELTEALDISQPKISRHLAGLRESGLLKDRRQGTWVFYHLNEHLPEWVDQLLTVTADNHQNLIQADQKRLQAMGNRPERTLACCSV